MKITRSDQEKLVIVDFPYGYGVPMLIVALAILGHFLWQFAHEGTKHVEWIGHIFGFALPFLGAILLLKRSVFEFDLARRQLVWSRVGIFGWKGGTVPFSQIKSAYVDSSSDSDGTTYRVSLMLLEGVLPLTTTLSGGIGAKCNTIRDMINEALGVATQLPEGGEDGRNDGDIRALVASGRKIAAIEQVRMRRKCSLLEAKTIVEAMGRS